MNKWLVLVLIYGFTLSVNAEGYSEGETLFKTRCASVCHQAPAASRLKPKQWKIVLSTMQVRMKSFGLPPLTDKETEQLLAYLVEAR